MVYYAPPVVCRSLVREALLELVVEAGRLDEIEEEVATLAAHIHAGTHRLLTLVSEFDRARGWERGGHRSCAHWLSSISGIDLGASREKVRAARALTELPETSTAMSQGDLSFSAVRALTRVATPENESDLLELTAGSTVAEIERTVRGWKLGSRQSELEREEARHESRSFSVFPDHEGMYVVRGRLTPEVGALLMRAVEAAGDQLYRERRPPATGVEDERDAAETPESASAETSLAEGAQRRADAMGLVAERALASGFGSAGADPDAESGPVSGTRAARYQVVLHVDGTTLSEDGGLGRSELEDGTRVSAEASRRLACDAAVVEVKHDEAGGVLDVGRRTRTIPPAIRRALEARDRGCRFPGCGLRYTDAHHVKHWADGGDTSLENLLLLCSYHHRLVHDRGWRVEWWPGGRPAFVDPRGQVHVNGRLPAGELPPHRAGRVTATSVP